MTRGNCGNNSVLLGGLSSDLEKQATIFSE